MKLRDELLVLSAITLLAFALRLYHIDYQCLTWDEGFTKFMANSDLTTIFSLSFLWDSNPPLYYLTIHYLFTIFTDQSSFILRIPAAIASTVAIPVIYLIGKEYKDELLGFLMAITCTISYTMIFYGQFARPYSYVMLAFAVVTLSFIKIFKTDHWKWYLLLAISSALCMWSHAYSFVPLFLIWIYLLWIKRTKVLWWAGLTFIWCAPFLYYIEMVTRRSHEHYGGTWDAILGMMPLELFWIPAVLILPLFAWLLIANRRYILADPKLYLGLVAASTMLSMLPLSFFNPIFPRYAMLIVPIVLAIALAPIADLIHRYRNLDKKAAIAGAYIFFIFACSYTPLIAWYFITTCPYKLN